MHMAWGITAALNDVSDLFKETLNDNQTQYFVEGSWKDLRITSETIEIKNSEPIQLDVKSTHRGPLVNGDLLRAANVIFTDTIPY